MSTYVNTHLFKLCVFVCVCVCMYMCMYVCMYICIYVRTYVSYAYVSIYVKGKVVPLQAWTGLEGG
jgi:hypothetical protein